MKRAKKIVLISHCYLNVNSKLEGIAIYSSVLKQLINVLIEEECGIIQLPCVEQYVGGIKRWSQVCNQLDKSYIASNIGVKSEVNNIPWESLIVALNQGQYDAVISAITPLEAQSAGELVDFTIPYMTLNEIIITKKENNSINSKKDLENKIIGVQDSSSASIAAGMLLERGIKVKDIKKYDRNANAVADLHNGRIDAIIVGEAYAATSANNDANIKIINDSINSADVVIVLRKGDEELKNALNNSIQSFLQSDYNKAILKKWIPFRD